MQLLAEIKKAQQLGQPSIKNEMLGELSTLTPSSVEIDNFSSLVFDYYTNRIPHHTWTPADKKDIVGWVQKTLADCGGVFNPLNQEIVDVEKKFDITFEEDWAKYEYEINGEKITGFYSIAGTVDLIVKEGESYSIVDYKSGKRICWVTGKEKDLNYFDDDPQLMIYYLALSKVYPEIKNILMNIYYVNYGGMFTMAFSEKHMRRIMELLQRRFLEIKKNNKPKRNLTWKCDKLCHFRQNTFEGTGIKPAKEFRDGRVTKKGEIMCMCEQTSFLVEKFGADKIMEQMTSPGFSVSSYKAPGKLA